MRSGLPDAPRSPNQRSFRARFWTVSRPLFPASGMLPPKVRQMHPAGLFPRLSPFADLAREGDKLIAGQWGDNKVTIWLELDAAPFGCHGPLTFRRDDNAVDHGLLSSAMCSLSGFHVIGSAAFIAFAATDQIPRCPAAAITNAVPQPVRTGIDLPPRAGTRGRVRKIPAFVCRAR
jgi:hypothetical protein